MAAGKKLKSILIRLVSSAGSGYFYATTKNPTNIQHKLALMKVRPRPVGRGDARAQRTKRRQREIMRAWRLRTRARPPPPRADASHTPAPPPRVCHRRPSACSLTRSSGNTCCSTRRRCPRAAAAAAPASRRAVACAAAARATRHAPITCMEEGTAHPPHPSHYPSPVWRVLLCVAPLEGLRCSSTHSARRQAARALWRRRGTRAGRPPPLLPGAERVAVAGGAPVSHRAPPPLRCSGGRGPPRPRRARHALGVAWLLGARRACLGLAPASLHRQPAAALAGGAPATGAARRARSRGCCACGAAAAAARARMGCNSVGAQRGSWSGGSRGARACRPRASWGLCVPGGAGVVPPGAHSRWCARAACRSGASVLWCRSPRSATKAPPPHIPTRGVRKCVERPHPTSRNAPGYRCGARRRLLLRGRAARRRDDAAAAGARGGPALTLHPRPCAHDGARRALGCGRRCAVARGARWRARGRRSRVCGWRRLARLDGRRLLPRAAGACAGVGEAGECVHARTLGRAQPLHPLRARTQSQTHASPAPSH